MGGVASCPGCARCSKRNRSEQKPLAEMQAWSLTRDETKTGGFGPRSTATLSIPNRKVGWVIGTNGSNIKEIESTYKVDAKVASDQVRIYGKHSQVKQAMDHVNWFLSE